MSVISRVSAWRSWGKAIDAILMLASGPSSVVTVRVEPPEVARRLLAPAGTGTW